MPDTPPEVAYGQVVGHFVSFLADTGDAGTTPDEMPLAGKVVLAPLTLAMRWPTTVPPRMAVPETVSCPLVGGDLTAPDGAGEVWLMASRQPEAQPTLCQWRATFHFDGVVTQPAPVVFEVPSGGAVDVSQAIAVPAEPPVLVVVSTESQAAAAASASDAAASEAAAAQSAQDAADYAASGNPGPQGDPGLIVLDAVEPVPPGTPPGTVVLRTAPALGERVEAQPT